jgi:hypothetical protein
MCFAHVIDLCSGQVTRNASNMVDGDGDESSQSDNETAGSGPIACGRNTVQVIRGSETCQDAFEDVIKNGNDKGWFKAGQPRTVVKIKALELL